MDKYELKIPRNINDFKILIFVSILEVITLVYMLFVMSSNIVAVAMLLVLSVCFLITRIVDWIYYGRTVILNADGCTFVSSSKTKTYSWDSIYLFHTKDSSAFSFGCSEIPGEGVILSVEPVKMPLYIRAMTYCKYTHPSTSVFIRFENLEMDRSYAKASQLYLTGFVAAKEDVLRCLQYKQ